MNLPKIDTSDPGRAALVFACGTILLARVEGMRAENKVREIMREYPAHQENEFLFAIEDFLRE